MWFCDSWRIDMNYGYIRVSTISQNIDRQLLDLEKEGLEYKNIFIDRESGKDFERTQYKKLIRKLRSGDLLVVKSIDRLGRNYKMIINEWRLITKEIGADIKVIDMPLLNTTINSSDLMRTFISDIVLQILSFVAENERKNIKQRQAEGIKAAKLRGVKFGRPQIELPINFKNVCQMYKNKEITSFEASALLDIKRPTFFKYLKKMTNENNI